jgi:hypothetical protein
MTNKEDPRLPVVSRVKQCRSNVHPVAKQRGTGKEQPNRGLRDHHFLSDIEKIRAWGQGDPSLERLNWDRIWDWMWPGFIEHKQALSKPVDAFEGEINARRLNLISCNSPEIGGDQFRQFLTAYDARLRIRH